MKPSKIFQLLGIFIALMLFVPTGFEFLNDALVDLNIIEEQPAGEDTQLIKRLDNPDKFSRDYYWQVNGDLHSFYNLPNLESRIREVHDKFGIQLYFIEYAMDFTEIRSSSTVLLKEVKQWISEEINDPYGLYFVLAQYVIDYDSPAYNKDIRYWDYELDGQVIFGDEVDNWWNTEVQKAFEYSALDYDYTMNSYNAYEDFINSISRMELEGCKATEEEDEPNPAGDIFVFLLFSVLPIILVIMYIRKEIKTHRAKKAEQQANEVKDILATPLKTLEEEYAEELKEKYK